MTWLAIDGGPAENLHRGRGIGVFARAMARSLDDDGVDPRVAYVSSRPIGSDESRWRARSRSARWTGVDARIPDRVAVAWQLVDTARVLPRDVRRTGADVFLATDPNAIAIDRHFATVAVAYDFIPLVLPDQYSRGARATLRRIAFAQTLSRFRQAKGLIAISQATRQDALRFLGVAPSSVEVVPLAVDHAVFHPGAASGRTSPTGGAPYLLYVGEADARKNVGALIEAFLDLAIGDVHLVLAGGSPRTGDTLRALCAGKPTTRIHFVGPVDEAGLAGLYAGAMAFVFPSVYEGFGLPILEAFACGAPVICTPRSALLDVAGAAALFADPDRPGALKDAIGRVVREPGLRSELRGRGLERAASFTWRGTRDGFIAASRQLGHRG